MNTAHTEHNKFPAGGKVKLGNFLYKRCFPVYKSLYFAYKKHKDKKTVEFLRGTVKPGMEVFDIGANIGFYAALLSSLVGEKGRVHAFEPEAANYRHLALNVGKKKNIVLNNSAIGNRTGRTKLYHSIELNTRHQTYDAGEERRHTEADIIRLDDYCRNGEKVDFIKIDVEGYEYHALLGMEETIKRSIDVVIFSEFWPYGIRRSGLDPKKYLSFLENIGFEIHFFDSDAGESRKVCQDDRFFVTSFYCKRK